MSLPNYANLEFGNNNMVSASKKIMNFERQATEIYKQSNADPLTSTGESPKDAVDEMLLGLNEINANISQLKTYTDESKRKERKYAPTREAFENAIALEACAHMAYHAIILNSNIQFPQYILNKHFSRKHGANAYYGQAKIK